MTKGSAADELFSGEIRVSGRESTFGHSPCVNEKVLGDAH
jgi:hypothetical protein